MTKRIIWLVVFMAAGSLQAHAQATHLTPKNLALGGGGVSYIEGYHANFINPANLMLGEGEPRVTLGILGGLSFTAGGPLANIHLYNKYFTKGLTVSGDLSNKVLGKWFGSDPSQMKYAAVQGDFVPFGLSYRGNNLAIGLAIRSRTMTDAGITKGAARLAIDGLSNNFFGDGLPVNISSETLTFYEASLGVSVKILDIRDLGFAKNVKVYAGAAPKLLLGANTYKANFNSHLTFKGSPGDIQEIDHNFNYQFETTGSVSEQLKAYYTDRENGTETDIGDYVDPEPEDFYGIKASGFGLDIGATMEMDLHIPVLHSIFQKREHLQVGVSLTDIGKMTFDDQVGVFSAAGNLAWRGFHFNKKEIDEKYDGDRQDYIDHVVQDSILTGIYNSFTPQQVSQVSRHLPTMLQYGARLFLNRWSISVAMENSLNQAGVYSPRNSFSAGLEYNLLGFLPLRAGIRTGANTGTIYSAGLGLEFRHLELSAAVASTGSAPNGGSDAALALSGIVIKF
jgi:hypothetical protein